jgi:hypothetical protein
MTSRDFCYWLQGFFEVSGADAVTAGQAMSEQHPKPHTTWRHLKTDSLYVVLGVALCSTNGALAQGEKAVVYYSVDRQRLHYRALTEFMDGRFVEVWGKP